MLLLPLGHRCFGSITEVGTGGWGANARDVLQGGLSFPAGLGGPRYGEPRKGWGKLSFALNLAPASSPPPWPQLPEPMGLHISPFSSSSPSSSPMSLAGPPHSCSLAPWGVPKHSHGPGDSRWLWQCGRDINSSSEVPRTAMSAAGTRNQEDMWDSRAQWGALERCQQIRGDCGRM